MAASRPPSRGGAKATKIPQVSWREPHPAPLVLVSGPEEVCAERAIAGVRDYLRAEDPALEVSDVRADDYAPGTLLSLTSPSLFGDDRGDHAGLLHAYETGDLQAAQRIQTLQLVRSATASIKLIDPDYTPIFMQNAVAVLRVRL